MDGLTIFAVLNIVNLALRFGLELGLLAALVVCWRTITGAPALPRPSA